MPAIRVPLPTVPAGNPRKGRRRCGEERRGDRWVTLTRIGRRYTVVEVDGRPSKQLLENNALRPGERRKVKGEGGRWRLRYHYGSTADEAAGRVPLEDLVVTLREG